MYPIYIYLLFWLYELQSEINILLKKYLHVIIKWDSKYFQFQQQSGFCAKCGEFLGEFVLIFFSVNSKFKKQYHKT